MLDGIRDQGSGIRKTSESRSKLLRIPDPDLIRSKDSDFGESFAESWRAFRIPDHGSRIPT